MLLATAGVSPARHQRTSDLFVPIAMDQRLRNLFKKASFAAYDVAHAASAARDRVG